MIKNRTTNQYFRYPLDKTPLELILNKNYLIEQMQRLDGKIIDDKYFNFSIQNKDNKINLLKSYLGQNLPRIQMPRKINSVTHIPKTSIGKNYRRYFN